MSAAWVDGMRRAQVLDVAHALGLREQGKALTSWCLGPCPACKAERRHTKSEPIGRSGRGPIGVQRGKPPHGWRCFQCDASGSTIDLVAFVLCDKRYRDLRDHERATVKEWCERWTHSEPARAAQREPERAPEPPPSYPPIAEVQDLYEACGRVDENRAVDDYLRTRRIGSTRVADLGLARALPRNAPLPQWASCGSSWSNTGHLVIAPLFDHEGIMRSLIARSIDRDAERKSLAPRGHTRAGLVLGCALAVQVLASGKRPAWWGAHVPLDVVVCEGEIDFLAWSTSWSDAHEYAPATIGMVQGAWSDAIAARVPDGARVLLAQDLDAPGEKYAALVVETLRDRSIEMRRWRPEVAA